MQLSEALQQLSDIIASFEASYEATDDASGEAEFAPVLASVTDPWVEAVHRSSEALSTSAPSRYAKPMPRCVIVDSCLSSLRSRHPLQGVFT